MLQTLHTKLTKAEIAQKILTLQGNPYSLKQYPMFVSIFNSNYPRKLMRSGRQVSKTTIIAADMATLVTTTPYKRVIYCNSSAAQTQSFSNSKLDPFLQQSPYVYHNVLNGKKIIDNVFNKILKNYSEIIMSYFSETADRVRGRSGDNMYLDEVQDMLWDAMIDAEECLSASMDPKFVYAGTSKSVNTPLEFLWSESTQKEWVIKCDGCGKFNRPSHENIDIKGLVCKSCGHLLDTYKGQWHAFNPGTPDKRPFCDGYWIPQIIMPMHCNNEEKWKALLKKRDMYSPVKFDNEVLGLPNGEGDSPITEEMVRAMCIPNLKMHDKVCPDNADGASSIVAGIDWGGGGDLGVSRTVLSIYAVYKERPLYKKIFGKIFTERQSSPSLFAEDKVLWKCRKILIRKAFFEILSRQISTIVRSRALTA